MAYRGRSRWRAGTTFFSSGCLTTGPLEWVRNGFKVGPNYCRPPAPVAEDWIEAKNASVQNRHLQDWWQVFQDAPLNALVDTAYEQNLNLRIAGTRVLEARAQQAIAVVQAARRCRRDLRLSER